MWIKARKGTPERENIRDHKRRGRIVKRKSIVALAVVLALLFSFIFVVASGITQLSNEKILFLFLDETKGEPGTVEVASLALFSDAKLPQELIKVNPLASTEALKKEGISLLDSLIKANTLEEGIENAKAVAESETHTKVDRVVLLDASALKEIIDAVHPIPIDKEFTVTVMDRTFTLSVATSLTGTAAEQCIRGEAYPLTDEELLKTPEDYLWEVKAEIINSVTRKLFDFDQYTPEEQKSLAYITVEQYRNDLFIVYKKNTVLLMVYYLPEVLAKQIVSFTVRRIA